MKLKLYRILGNQLDITRSSLSRFSETAPKKYKVYSIPKRTSGHRVIAHPSKRLKYFQRALVEILEPVLCVHKASYAYKKNVSIRDNAERHVNSNYLLKMDFSNFFNSITPPLFFMICDRNDIKWSDAEKRLLTSLLFWNRTKIDNSKLVLSVGAPSSPLISNFVMHDFDAQINRFCENNKITYTRYADDITFSTHQQNLLFNIPPLVNDILSETYKNALTINNLKTRYASKAHNRHVTGITLTNTNTISLGRSRKRYISSLIHKFKLGILNDTDIYRLQGLIGFAMSIEPEFLVRMREKYSSSCINDILQIRARNDI